MKQTEDKNAFGSAGSTPEPIVCRPHDAVDYALDAALGGRVASHFQPIVEVGRGETIGHEMLARFASYGPLDLLARAAARSRSFDLETEMIRAAGDAVSAHAPGGLVFLNASPRTVCDPRFVEIVRTFITRTRGAREGVVLELTEHGAGLPGALLTQRCDDLRELGVEIAIDDLGAGGSGLTRLAVLRPEWIKIDRHLVHGIAADAYRRELLGSITGFANSWGARVLAEGVEDEADAATIASVGVAYAQGYLFGRPAPAPARAAGNRSAA